jgi:hypothetical protein
MWDEHEARSREEQVKTHELAPALAKPEVEKAGFQIVEVRDPPIERPPDRDAARDDVKAHRGCPLRMGRSSGLPRFRSAYPASRANDGGWRRSDPLAAG